VATKGKAHAQAIVMSSHHLGAGAMLYASFTETAATISARPVDFVYELKNTRTKQSITWKIVGKMLRLVRAFQSVLFRSYSVST